MASLLISKKRKTLWFEHLIYPSQFLLLELVVQILNKWRSELLSVLKSHHHLLSPFSMLQFLEILFKIRCGVILAVLQILDADNGERLESSTGRIATRDIVQFVPMREVHGEFMPIFPHLAIDR